MKMNERRRVFLWFWIPLVVRRTCGEVDGRRRPSIDEERGADSRRPTDDVQSSRIVACAVERMLRAC